MREACVRSSCRSFSLQRIYEGAHTVPQASPGGDVGDSELGAVHLHEGNLEAKLMWK